VPSDHRTDGLRTAKDSGLLGLLEYGLSGCQRIIATWTFEGAHRCAPWKRMLFIPHVTYGDTLLIGAKGLRLKFSRFCF
jgi:hypothetical protein